MTEHGERTTSEYKRLLDEAISAAGRRRGAEWNDAFIVALADRNLTIATSVHPHSRREWYPDGYPYTAPLAASASNAWPEGSLVVWTPEFTLTAEFVAFGVLGGN